MTLDIATDGSGLQKVKRAPGFVQIDNATIRDSRLSWKARGLLAYLLSMPDGWRVNAKALAEAGPDGRESVQNGLLELRRAGYYRLERRRLEDGSFRMVTAVAEVPNPQWAEEAVTAGNNPVDVPAGQTGNGFPGSGSPGSGSPGSGSPASPGTGFPAPVNPFPIEDSMKEESPLSPDVGDSPYVGGGDQSRGGVSSEEPEGFMAFWDAYPKKTSKAQARMAWVRALQRTDPETLADALERRAVEWKSKEPRWIPNPATWLDSEPENDTDLKFGPGWRKTADSPRERWEHEDGRVAYRPLDSDQLFDVDEDGFFHCGGPERGWWES